MAQNPAPPRPGGPPRPSPDGSRARPAARARPKMGGSSWSPGDDAVKPAAALEKPEFVKNPAPAKSANEHLAMVPLTGDKAATYDDGKKDSSTSFFAIPGANRSRSDVPAAAPAGPPRAVPAAPIAGPVPMGPMAVGPMAVGPQPVGGIAGPVAGGLAPAPGMGMPNSAFGTQAIQEDRSSSSRVLVLVVMLVMVVCMALITAVGLMMFAILQTQTEVPLEVPAAQSGGGVTGTRPPVETGLNLGDKKPSTKPTPTEPKPQRPQGGTAPKPAGPKPAAPAPVVPAGPAAGTLTIVKPDSEFFSSVEVRCGPGFRQRGDFVGNTASVPNVPAEACEVTFKGGAAAPKLKITGARKYTCSGTGGSMICR